MSKLGASGICCRQIGIADIDAVVTLLTNGFRIRPRDFWMRAFQRLAEHSTPPGYPKYGYLLECNGKPVGIVLLIFSSIAVNGEKQIRCSMSSLYVEPPFRSYAPMLRLRALNQNDVTYFNITPVLHTWPILEAQGFVRYCEGQFVAVPAFSSRVKGSRVEVITPESFTSTDLQSFEAELLRAHAKYGCISVVCVSEGERQPFVFLPLRKPAERWHAYLAYCRDLKEFVRFAGPLGRFLAWRKYPFVIVDADGPINGLIGKYYGRIPKYFRGPDKPRLGDIAYSERVMFDF